jgi:hypothetical protein
MIGFSIASKNDAAFKHLTDKTAISRKDER